jgi:hypothetical protein
VDFDSAFVRRTKNHVSVKRHCGYVVRGDFGLVEGLIICHTQVKLESE